MSFIIFPQKVRKNNVSKVHVTYHSSFFTALSLVTYNHCSDYKKKVNMFV